MRIFLTGASGFVGSAVLPQLTKAGHTVVALARSEASAAAAEALGAEVLRGDLEHVDSLRAGAAKADAVIHCAFRHDFQNFHAATELDRTAIEMLGQALAGSGRPLIVTSGTLLAQRSGPLALESDPPIPQFPRRSEQAALAFADHGVPVTIVRLPPSVHGPGDHAFVPYLIGLAREKGVAGYIGDGAQRWPAVHRDDAATLYRLAVEQPAPSRILHAVADEGIAVRDIAAVIGRHVGCPVASIAPEDAEGHFGWMTTFIGIDGPASSARTRAELGWKPNQPGLLADIEANYFAARS